MSKVHGPDARCVPPASTARVRKRSVVYANRSARQREDRRRVPPWQAGKRQRAILIRPIDKRWLETVCRRGVSGVVTALTVSHAKPDVIAHLVILCEERWIRGVVFRDDSADSRPTRKCRVDGEAGDVPCEVDQELPSHSALTKMAEDGAIGFANGDELKRRITGTTDAASQIDGPSAHRLNDDVFVTERGGGRGKRDEWRFRDRSAGAQRQQHDRRAVTSGMHEKLLGKG